MKDKFENNIKSLLDSYEAEFNPADWADMNKRLDSIKAGKNNTSSQWIRNLLIAASMIVIAGLAYYKFSDKHESQITTSNSTPIQSNAKKEVQQPVQSLAPSKNIVVEENKTSEEVSTADKISVAETKKEIKNINATQVKESSEKDSPVNQQVISKEETQSPVVALQPSLSEPQDKAPVLSASFSMNLNTVCEGAPIQFIPKDMGKDNVYKWYFGDGETSADPNPTHTYKTKGNYTVRLRITDKSRKYDEQKNMINVLEAPSVEINFNTSEDNRTFNFESDASRNTEVKWDFGDAKSATDVSPVHMYSKYGSYKVTLTAKNSVGCTSVITKEIKVENIVKLFAPNAFSPDGDNLNDDWLPEISGDYNVTISIQDMNGNVVYTTSSNTPWDGTNNKTGEKVKVGSMYTWTAIIKDKQGNISRDKGNITIK